MSLAIEESTREDIVILTLRGQLTFRDSDDIYEKIQALGAAGHLKVILDLTHVFYIDSTGLGAMVGGYTSLTKKGGTLKLVNPNKRNLELLLVTQLHTLFEVFNEVQDAVDSFFPQRKGEAFRHLQLDQKGGRRGWREIELQLCAFVLTVFTGIPPAGVQSA
jgi:anti-sigma B factor antagonist